MSRWYNGGFIRTEAASLDEALEELWKQKKKKEQLKVKDRAANLSPAEKAKRDRRIAPDNRGKKRAVFNPATGLKE